LTYFKVCYALIWGTVISITLSGVLSAERDEFLKVSILSVSDCL